jgi:5S rRNA maturation endonuclease (ribonuclease M5)
MSIATDIRDQVLRTREKYTDRLWGKLPKLHLPSMIVDKQSNQLVLDDHALSILVALLSIQRNDARRRSKSLSCVPVHPVAVVEIGREDLMRITGMSKNLITKGVESLERAGYIQRCRQRVPYTPGAHDEETSRYKQFAVSTYTLLNPTTGHALDNRSEDSLLFANGLHYFSIPVCIVAAHPKSKPSPYSFDTMTFPEKRLYIVLIWLARQYDANEYDTPGLYLKCLTGLNDRALKKALDGLESRWLVLDTSDDLTIRHIHIALRNPITRELLSEMGFDPNPRNNACNYYEECREGESKRADLKMPHEIAEGLFLQLLQKRGQTATREGNGEYKFRCPFHDDSTPSCNFNPKKECFYCFAAGCNSKGSTQRLLQKLADASGEETIRAVSEAMGKNLDYRDPDWEVIAIYSYRDKFGNVKKQLLRLQDDADGNRRFSQRRMGKDGWIFTTKGLKPMLFNLDLFDNAFTVFVVEGPKDAVTITDLALMAGNHKAIGTTSGGADSWVSVLAKDLKHKRVIILPDNDEAGERYSRGIQDSLKAEGIEYHVVSFNGTGAKDVTEYLENHTVEDLVRLVGPTWILMPDGTQLEGSDPGNRTGPYERIVCFTDEITL